MNRLTKFEQIEKELNANLFESFNGLSNDEKALRKAELLINPVRVSYGIGGDLYKATISDFSRNGRMICVTLENGSKKQFSWNERGDFPRFKSIKGQSGTLYLRFHEAKRDRSF